MRKVLVLVAGMPGSGKSVFSDVARSLGIPVITLGDVVREEVAKRGLPVNPENMAVVAQELRDRYGKHSIAMLSLDRVQKALENSCIVIIDGIRSLEEVEYLRSSIDAEVVLVGIHSSPKMRFTRLISRSRADDPKNWSEFVERDFRELSWGLGNVIALSDVILVNEGSIDDFKSAIRNLLLKVVNLWCT